MSASVATNRLRRVPDALRRVPRATYRVQLSPAFTFDDAAALADYLAALGVSDLYTSPFFETASDNSHGYDVSDHNAVRDEIGGEPGLRRLAAALAEQDLGLLIDVVPNHMGIGHARNAWWRDVLENGPSSPYAPYFDIDWEPVKHELRGKVLLPILGDQYGAVLDSGQLRLELTDGLLSVRYHETELPIAPRSYGRVLSHRLETLQDELAADHPDLIELKSVITWFATIPPPRATDAPRLAERAQDKETGRQRLVQLLARSPAVSAFVAENLRLYNGTPGDPRSFDLLDALLGEQAYRLAYWRVAGEEINYRRFFDVNDLAAIRMEDPRVFADAHRLIDRLVREGIVTGLRVDHPDGLYAPAEYFRRLQDLCRTDDEAGARPFYIVAEKILAHGERLPDTWAVAGTTGYEFMNLLAGIFVDRREARAVEQIYARHVRERLSFAEIVYRSKRLIVETTMASELNVLGHRLNRISEKHRSSRDFTLRSLTHALREIIACFPVYRTYVGEREETGASPAEIPAGPDPAAASAADHEHLERAVELAKRRAPTLDPSIFDWIRDLLALRFPASATEEDRRERLDFVRRFQQITGPVTAKGFEDTALYRYHRLISLNDVGGEPSRFGTSMAEFHAVMQERQEEMPAGLSATSTHDTKRSEDVRARISVLSEIPDEWRRRIGRWHRLNRRHRATVDGEPVPRPDEEYFLYQTLIGAWPISADRLQGYLVKAMREAKTSTSWVNPNLRYEQALTRFAETIIDARRSREFLRDFGEFQARVAHWGALASLAQVLLKVTAPGIPDFYQGTELWDLSLVDPDNRRPVDFALRRRLLTDLVAEIEGTHDLAGLARLLIKTKHDGRVKLFVTRQALSVRRARPALFLHGRYDAIDATGTWAESLCAFARVHESDLAVVLAPRLLARRAAGDVRAADLPLGETYWEDTALPLSVPAGTRVRDAFTGAVVEVASGPGEGAGGHLPVGRVLADFPLALLVREP